MTAPRGADLGAVRDEDAFDAAAVDRWLRDERPELALTGLPEVQQFSKGASNLTYLLRYPEADLILRRPPAGTKAKSAHDMGREYRVQQALKGTFPYVPEVLGLCTDPAVLGDDFYVMRRIEGTILRAQIPSSISFGPEEARALCERFAGCLADLHTVDPTQPGLRELSRGDGYVRRQVEGWSDRYGRARTWNVPRFGRVMRWLEANQPADSGSCVIHNDYRLDNVVLAPDDPGQIIGVLDWEMATIGDPLMDLGGALAYWVEAGDPRGMRWLRRQPSDAPGMLSRAELVEAYLRASGRPPTDTTFYEVFGLFRLAVIVQQIYQRYHLGHTTNPVFKRYWVAVHLLERRCRWRIAQGT